MHSQNAGTHTHTQTGLVLEKSFFKFDILSYLILSSNSFNSVVGVAWGWEEENA